VASFFPLWRQEEEEEEEEEEEQEQEEEEEEEDEEVSGQGWRGVAGARAWMFATFWLRDGPAPFLPPWCVQDPYGGGGGGGGGGGDRGGYYDPYGANGV
jgi:hypothetical protein